MHDTLPDEERERVIVVDVPFVEGGVAAAVAAESGADLARGRRGGGERSVGVGGCSERDPGAEAPAAPPSAVGASASGTDGTGRYVREVTLRNRDGLHARPAAEFVKLANTFPAEGDGQRQGCEEPARHHVAGAERGQDRGDRLRRSGGSVPAVDALADLVETGFGEA